MGFSVAPTGLKMIYIHFGKLFIALVAQFSVALASDEELLGGVVVQNVKKSQ